MKVDSEGTQEEKKRQRFEAAAWEMLCLTYAILDLSMAFVWVSLLGNLGENRLFIVLCL